MLNFCRSNSRTPPAPPNPPHTPPPPTGNTGPDADGGASAERAAALLEMSPYTITISDTAANVSASLDALAGKAEVTSIVLTDGATTPLTLSVQQYANDAGLLNEIKGPYSLAIRGRRQIYRRHSTR